MFEDWLQAGGDWAKSCLYLRLTSKSSSKSKGCYRTFTRQQLLDKYNNDSELVDDLCARKVKEGHTQPDENFPDRKDLLQYWCWDTNKWDKGNEVSEEMELGTAVDQTATSDIVGAGAFGPIELPRKLSSPGMKGASRFKAAESPSKTSKKRAPDADSEDEGGPKPKPKKGKGGTPNCQDTENKPNKTTADPMKLSRQAANKAIKDIGNLLVDTQSWGSRLREANVPEPMVTALSQTSSTWQKELSLLRSSLETNLITALNTKNVEALDKAVQSANGVIEKYNAESVTAKRLMAPAPKGKAKAKAKASSALP